VQTTYNQHFLPQNEELSDIPTPVRHTDGVEMVPPLLLNPGEMSDPNRVIPTPKKKKAADDCRLLG